MLIINFKLSSLFSQFLGLQAPAAREKPVPLGESFLRYFLLTLLSQGQGNPVIQLARLSLSGKAYVAFAHDPWRLGETSEIPTLDFSHSIPKYSKPLLLKFSAL